MLVSFASETYVLAGDYSKNIMMEKIIVKESVKGKECRDVIAPERINMHECP